MFKADRCFDRIPIHFKDTLMYVDPITRQVYVYATPITCDNNPRNIIELDRDSDDQDFYILAPEPTKRKPPEHKAPTSPIQNTPDKLSSVMSNRTLRDLTNLLDPDKRNPSETPITTHLLQCYDRTHKLLQTLDLDSQSITRSSQAIQSAVESITTLFNSTNLH